jgi:hypothetical protein
MLVEIRAQGEDGSAVLQDFFRWLREDEDGPDGVRLRRDPAADPGVMGAGEVIQIVLAQSTALASLAMQYVSWRRSRTDAHGGAGFTFTRASDGLSVTVERGSDDDVRRLMSALAPPPVLPEPREPGGPADR